MGLDPVSTVCLLFFFCYPDFIIQEGFFELMFCEISVYFRCGRPNYAEANRCNIIRVTV
jgi:hypothetical protein